MSKAVNHNLRPFRADSMGLMVAGKALPAALWACRIDIWTCRLKPTARKEAILSTIKMGFSPWDQNSPAAEEESQNGKNRCAATTSPLGRSCYRLPKADNKAASHNSTTVRSNAQKTITISNYCSKYIVQSGASVSSICSAAV
ncbi:hypothetical protein SapgrDRAFT_0008 [Saprospira grandis DSM 2844]|uniref:Uncharacterized protein n=1 Tax=Saprospira grandis DSM 2844 TaxID=694433 RepID=J0NWB0_9BACT|nr:hypothetical protein SapgrDRAFT_0008 [Saprospira grandis DSM 2844]